MYKKIISGLGIALLVSTSTVLTNTAAANGLFGGKSPISSNLSFNNGVKLYVGGGVGYARQGDACNMPFFEGSCDDGSMSGKVYGGVRLNPMFGAELGYAKLGTAEKQGAIAGQAIDVSNEISGYQLTGVGYLPIDSIPNLELMGKGGAMFWKRDTTAKLDTKSDPSRDNGIAPMLGLGAQYQLDQNLHLRSEWEHIINTGSNSVHETDADNYTVGLMYSTL